MSASDKFYNYDGAERPTITDYLEHGHIGGTDSGAPYKSTYSPPVSTYIDEVGSVTYVGVAPVGTPTSAAKWRIQKIEVVGTVTSMKWADGDSNWDNVWDNRGSLNYS